MARGKQLQELLAQLRAETGRSQDVSLGVDEAENLKEIIRRNQEILYDDYEWSFLRVERSITLANGQRYYDMPSDLNYDRIQQVRYKYNNVYTELERGIDFEDFSIFDSNADERSSPMLKWDIRNIDGNDQFEAWPIPNNVNSVHFLGTKALTPLTNDDDRADLDDRLIVLACASEILARQKSRDASAKLQQFNNRLLTLRRNDQSASKTVQIGLGNNGRDRSNRLKTRIIVS